MTNDPKLIVIDFGDAAKDLFVHSNFMEIKIIEIADKAGFELTFRVNCLSHFLLINFLIDRMTDYERIIILSSETHDPMTKNGKPEPIF